MHLIAIIAYLCVKVKYVCESTFFDSEMIMSNQNDYIFSSESVTEGHPDKVADAISDSVLDAIMAHDKKCRVACETMVTTGLAVIAGEITTNTYVDMPQIVRDTIRDIGYTSSQMGFDYETCAVITTIDRQSPDIAQGVDEGAGLYKEQGAGDQGIMFGYAVNETPELMPAPIHYAHKLCQRLALVRKNGTLPFLRPDGKSQVSFMYENHVPKKINTVVISTQHNEDVKYADLKEAVIEEVIKKVIPAELLSDDYIPYINPTGRFVVGGPMGDCGLTGRKIIVDTYGGRGHHGGGCFSGKDPSKVDRSAAYMGRYIAKNIVAAGIAERCEIQMAYAIGVAEPVSIMLDFRGSNVVDADKVEAAVRQVFKLIPSGIIKQLDLLQPFYRKTSAYGHFGREDQGFTWEKTDKVDELKSILKL